MKHAHLIAGTMIGLMSLMLLPGQARAQAANTAELDSKAVQTLNALIRNPSDFEVFPPVFSGLK